MLSVIHELRELISIENPYAVEEIQRQGLIYYDAQRGGPVKAGICQILIAGDEDHFSPLRHSAEWDKIDEIQNPV